MEFSKEEKEAIEDIDLLVHCLNYGEMKMTIASERQKEIAQELQMLINLLNKQQKEIEEKQTALDFSNKEIIKLKDMLIEKDKKIKDLSNYVYDKEYINKDKIREKIKEIDGKGTFDAKIVLEHLLEENNEKSDTL